jgi:AcrR family transcriptional regulator
VQAIVTRRSKKVEHGEATRHALVAAAREMFGDRGYADTSLDEIVRRAGCTKGALYHHFSGKRDLFRAVFEAVKKELSQQAFPVQVARDDIWGDLLSRCRSFIEAHVEPRVQRIVLLDARSVLSWEEWHRVESEYGVVMLRGGLRRAVHRRVIAPQPLQALAAILVGALGEACVLVANAADRERALDEAVAIIERLLGGLRPPGPEPAG